MADKLFLGFGISDIALKEPTLLANYGAFIVVSDSCNNIVVMQWHVPGRCAYFEYLPNVKR